MGFSGADIFTFFDVPNTLLNILERVLFFLPRPFVPLDSSEYLFDDTLNPLSERDGVSSRVRSPAEKLADCRSGVSIRGSGEVCESGGGGGRRREF